MSLDPPPPAPNSQKNLILRSLEKLDSRYRPQFYVINKRPGKFFYTDKLTMTILDSPAKHSGDISSVAVIFVPPYRESDPIFSTEGCFQILLEKRFQRVILIGNDVSTSEKPSNFHRLNPISFEERKSLIAYWNHNITKFCPNSAFEVKFLTCKDDNVIAREFNEDDLKGEIVGNMFVCNVEIDSRKSYSNEREFRRRLFFKQTLDFVQCEMILIPVEAIDAYSDVDLGKDKFVVDTMVLIQPHLIAMVNSISLISAYLGERIQGGSKPRVLCLGVGGGALVTFLTDVLKFDVVGVEADYAVLEVARVFFDLEQGQFLRLIVGNGIKLVEQLAFQEVDNLVDLSTEFKEKVDTCLIPVTKLYTKFDVIMIDLVSKDGSYPICAPPSDFGNITVLEAAKTVLTMDGMIVINVIPKDESFEPLANNLRQVFTELYEVEVNDNNHVLIATVSAIEDDDSFMRKLGGAVSLEFLSSIHKM
ncbi:hypothetical protein OROMI_033562 [Orobanche minor]